MSDYEARAYASLMRCQPATAYELAKQAGIPSSKIYEAVKRLQAKGLAQPGSADTD
ncbi:MAG: TrmB family transcriptional regulator, partial [Gemmatimonadetes bacterium]|nr:TrmB family transcriptional regulator [Gemmatimonadota bacterium]